MGQLCRKLALPENRLSGNVIVLMAGRIDR